MTDLLRIVFWNVLLLLVGLLLLELVFGTWVRPDAMNLLNITRDGTWRYQIDYFDIRDQDRDVVYRRDHWGLRGDFGQPREIDVLTIGGSTTEQRFITEGKTWQDVMAERFREAGHDVRVANAGVSGRTTFGHLSDFDHWFVRIPGLRPGYVLFFLGVNDMFFDRPNAYWDEVERNGKFSLKQAVKDHSALYYLYRTSIGVYWAHRYNLAHTSLDYRNGTWVDRPKRDDYREVLKPRLQSFQSRLELLARKVRRWGATPIFVTQARGDFIYREGKVFGLVETQSRITRTHRDEILGLLDRDAANGVDYYLMISLFNQVSLETCRREQGICIDMARELHFVVGDFYDHVHNTGQGAKKIGDYLFEKLKGRVQTKSSRYADQ